jgi:hypothetical protein
LEAEKARIKEELRAKKRAQVEQKRQFLLDKAEFKQDYRAFLRVSLKARIDNEIKRRMGISRVEFL